METVIRKKVKGAIMENIFVSSDSINIRYYEAINAENYDPDEAYTFEIKVRHNEDENPKELLEKAIKKHSK